MKLSLGRQVAKRGGIRKGREVPADYYPLRGGLNLVDSELEVPPGELLDVENYECAFASGYRIADGFERFDGRVSPSSAGYQYIKLKGYSADEELAVFRDPGNASSGKPGFDGVIYTTRFAVDTTRFSSSSSVFTKSGATDGSTYLFQCMVEKAISAPGNYPAIHLDGGSDEAEIILNTQTGQFIERSGSEVAGAGVVDYSNAFWLVWIAVVSDSTTVRARVYPSRNSSFADGEDITAMGRLNFDGVLLYEIPAEQTALPVRTNRTDGQLLRVERELSNSSRWAQSGSPAPNLNKIGYDGQTNSAFTLTDSDQSGHESIAQTVAVAASENLYLCSCFVEKKSEAPTTYPAVQAALGGDSSIIVDNFNGAVYSESGKVPAHKGIVSFDENWWLVWFTVQNNGSDTSAVVTLYPAKASDLSGSADTGSIGSCAFDLPVFKPYPFSPTIPLNIGAIPYADNTPGVEQLVYNQRQLDEWEQSAGVSVDQELVVNGFRGFEQTAWNVGDTSDSVSAKISHDIGFPNSVLYQRVVQVLVAKTTGAISNYPAVRAGPFGLDAASMIIDTTNGSISTGVDDGTYLQINDSGIDSYSDDYWLAWMFVEVVTAFNSWKLELFPAYNADGTTTADVAATGSAIFDMPAIYETLGMSLFPSIRDMTETAEWSVSGTLSSARNATGYDLGSNLGTTLTDSDGAAGAYIDHSESASSLGSSYIVYQVFVGKVGSAPAHYPVVGAITAGGSLEEQIIIDNFNGAIVPVTGSEPFAWSITSWDTNYWQVCLVVQNHNRNFAQCRLYPAFASALTGSTDSAATGANVFDQVSVRALYSNYAEDQDIFGYARELDNTSVWEEIGTPAATINITGFDGLPNRAATLTDNDGAATEAIKATDTVTAGKSVYLMQGYVERRGSGSAFYPAFRLGDVTGGNYAGVIIDNTNGVLYSETSHVPLDSGIVEIDDDYWLVWVKWVNTGTSVEAHVIPAAATALTGSFNVAAQGSTYFDVVEVYEGIQDYFVHTTSYAIDPTPRVQPLSIDSVDGLPVTGKVLDQVLEDQRVFDSSKWTEINTPQATANVIGYDGLVNRGYTLTDGDAANYEGISQSPAIAGSAGYKWLLQIMVKKESETGILHGLQLISTSKYALIDAYKGELVLPENDPEYVDGGAFDYNDDYWLFWLVFDSTLDTVYDFSSVPVKFWAAYANNYSRAAANLEGLVTVTGSVVIDNVSLTKGEEKPHFGTTIQADNGGSWVAVGLNNRQWADGEIVVVDGKIIGQVDGTPLTAHPNAGSDILITSANISSARSKIGTLPGTGDPTGVVQLDGVTYLFQDVVRGSNVDGGIWKSSPSGWLPLHAISTAVGSEERAVMNPKIAFSSGSAEPAIGARIEDNDKDNGAIVLKISLVSGSWAGGDAAGYLITSHFEAGINSVWTTGVIYETTGVTDIATSTAAAPQIKENSGKHEFRVHNFFGHESTESIYGVNGVDNGFELDPGPVDIFSKIETGMTSDKPTHLAQFKGSLFYSFTGGSIQYSGTATPLTWTVVTGASETAIGEEVTNMIEDKEDALIILSREHTQVMYWNGSAFELKLIEKEAGALPFTAQRLLKGIYLDDNGITTTKTVEAYGNFKSNSISRKIDPLLKLLGPSNANYASISRTLALYRLHYSDGTNIVVGFGPGTKINGITKTNYGFTVSLAHSREDNLGVERIFASGEGEDYLYEMDRGNSFDGANRTAYCYPAFYNSKSPRLNKDYNGMGVDMVAQGKCTLTVNTDVNNGRTTNNQPDQTIAITSTSESRKEMNLPLEVEGRNIQPRFDYSQSDEPSHELHGIALRLHQRNIDRVTRRS